MRDFNILFTSAGRRVSLVRHFKQTLNSLGLKGKIVVADLQKTAPAAFVADCRELVPKAASEDYIPALKNICGKHQISLLVPLIDPELYPLSLYKEDFEKLGVTVLVSAPEATAICQDKKKTYHFFQHHNFDTPKLFEPEEILFAPPETYPYFLKPAAGSSSIGATKINSQKELKFFLDYIPDAILQEYVTGEEYTLDILVDFAGQVRCVVPRLRLETRAGEVSKGITVKNKDIIKAGIKVAKALPGTLGCITVQCFLTPDRSIRFIEINPRFGGGFPLSIQAGADFPRWIIQMLLGQNPDIALDSWQDGLSMLRYDEAIFTPEVIFND